jgi:hypothetical protein
MNWRNYQKAQWNPEPPNSFSLGKGGEQSTPYREERRNEKYHSHRLFTQTLNGLFGSIPYDFHRLEASHINHAKADRHAMRWNDLRGDWTRRGMSWQ